MELFDQVTYEAMLESYIKDSRKGRKPRHKTEIGEKGIAIDFTSIKIRDALTRYMSSNDFDPVYALISDNLKRISRYMYITFQYYSPYEQSDWLHEAVIIASDKSYIPQFINRELYFFRIKQRLLNIAEKHNNVLERETPLYLNTDTLPNDGNYRVSREVSDCRANSAGRKPTYYVFEDESINFVETVTDLYRITPKESLPVVAEFVQEPSALKKDVAHKLGLSNVQVTRALKTLRTTKGEICHE